MNKQQGWACTAATKNLTTVDGKPFMPFDLLRELDGDHSKKMERIITGADVQRVFNSRHYCKHGTCLM